jgi:hypothetical protein
MRRLPFLLCTTLLGALLVAAGGEATQGSFRERLEAFLQRAQAERQRLGLTDRDAARRKYPTPEITLLSPPLEESGPGVVCLLPGKTQELVFKTRMPAGSLVGFDCDALEVLEEKATQGQLRVKVRARPDALPRFCELRAVAAVSAVESSVPVLRIGGHFVWELQLANGWSTRWDMNEQDCAGNASFPSTWSAKGKELGQRDVELSGEGNTWTAEVQAPESEQLETSRALQAQLTSPEYQGLIEKVTKLTEKMTQECPQQQDAAMTACFERYQKQLEPLNEKLEAFNARNDAASEVRKVGCSRLELTLAPGGTLQGTGYGCGAPGETAVKGRVTPAPTP